MTAPVKVEATVTVLTNDYVKIFAEYLFGLGPTRSDRIKVINIIPKEQAIEPDGVISKLSHLKSFANTSKYKHEN